MTIPELADQGQIALLALAGFTLLIVGVASAITGALLSSRDAPRKRKAAGKILLFVSCAVMVASFVSFQIQDSLIVKIDDSFASSIKSTYGVTADEEYTEVRKHTQQDGSRVGEILVNKDGDPSTAIIKISGTNVTVYDLDGKELPHL